MLEKSFPIDCAASEIQYVGEAGLSRPCLEAIERFVQYRDCIEAAHILSAQQRHCILLHIDGSWVAVKSGFSSGYYGEGTRTFAEALELLCAFGVNVEEFVVAPKMLSRLDCSALTDSDLKQLRSLRPIRPIRWRDYIYPWTRREFAPFKSLRDVMPWSIIDHRLVDLAAGFFFDPDKSIMTGFRRLEDIVRQRIQTDSQPGKVFYQAFPGEKSLLTWEGVEPSEHNGRAQIFVGMYLAYRNPRAHREIDSGPHDVLSEFLLLNHLYQLEASAVKRDISEDAQ